MRFRFTLASAALMGALVPLDSQLAASRLTYMLGHAGWLHYGVNMASWVMLWPLVSPGRLAAGYLAAVACSYLPTQGRLIGWSVMICFLTGIAFGRMRKERKWRVVGCLILGLLIPHLAGLQHGVMVAAGWVYGKVEGRWGRTI